MSIDQKQTTKNANLFIKWRNGRFALFGCHKRRLSRAIKTNLHSHFVSYSTVASFKHLRREEEASIGHTQFSAGKREESIQRKIGKWFLIFLNVCNLKIFLVFFISKNDQKLNEGINGIDFSSNIDNAQKSLAKVMNHRLDKLSTLLDAKETQFNVTNINEISQPG